jgi:alkyl hydroperoxide reductase subunit AhpC
MKKAFLFLLTLALSANLSFSLEINSEAPDFKLTGVKNGKEISLSQFQGKIIVLEWLNHGCPFIQKHYETQNMQKLQKKFVDQGVIWLSIISSGKGKQGHVDLKRGLEDLKNHGSYATNVLLDETGVVGKMYEAKTTPHMYIINPQRQVVYQGAIDDQSGLDREDIPSAKNYVNQALEEILANKAVSIPSTKAYGCSIKYAQ